jgi:putative DNA primase/helicase
MDMYHDTIALAIAKVFAEFERLLNQHPDELAELSAQVAATAAETLNQTKPPNPREIAEKTVRSCVSQYLISRGHSPKDLADAEAGARKKPKDKRIHPRRVRPNDNLPTIQVTKAEIKETVDLSERALIAADRSVYQRGGDIVGVTIAKGKSHSGEEITFQTIAERGEWALIEDLSCSAHYEEWDSRLGNGGDWAQTSPPMWVVRTLQQRSEKHLPPLVGVINAPTMRHDGSILSEPGYDKKTGLLFDPRGVRFPKVTDRPVLADAQAALDTITEPIKDFPFVSGVDLAVALSTVLTALVRRSLETSPLHAFSAPVAGSGKGKLVDYASVLATGEAAPAMAAGDNDEEMEKRLFSCALEGRAIIAIDNCTRPLSDIDLLCSLLTQQQVRGRPLGASKTKTVPANAHVTATGNNLTVVGDLTRRSIRCELDPGCESPELRTFEFEPIELAKRKRPELAVAALTILRAFHVAGRPAPEGVAPLGSYEDWSKLIRNALIWVGCADPVASQDKLRRDDPDKTELEDVMTQWWDVFGGNRATVAEVIESACELEPYAGYSANTKFARPLFRDALLAVAGAGGAVNAKRLGKWLKRYAGRIVGGIRVEQSEASRGVSAWRLVKTTTT